MPTGAEIIDWLSRSEATVDFKVGAITVHLKLFSELRSFTAATLGEACRAAYSWQADAITSLTNQAGGIVFQ